MTTTDPWAACDHDPTSTTAAPAAQPTTAATLELARADASAPRPAHHLHVVALGSAQHMQQTHLAGPAHPHAHRNFFGLSQPCSARTAGSSGSPSWAAASAYRLARTMIRAPPPRCTQKAGRRRYLNRALFRMPDLRVADGDADRVHGGVTACIADQPA